MPSEVPAIAKALIQFDKFDTISFSKGQLISAASIEVVWNVLAGSLFAKSECRQRTDNDQDVSGLQRIWFAQLRGEGHDRFDRSRGNQARVSRVRKTGRDVAPDIKISSSSPRDLKCMLSLVNAVVAGRRIELEA